MCSKGIDSLDSGSVTVQQYRLKSVSNFTENQMWVLTVKTNCTVEKKKLCKSFNWLKFIQLLNLKHNQSIDLFKCC